MAIEVLRLFEGTPHNNEDWSEISTADGNGYSTNDINNIKDPAANTMKEMTSIPSPFARLHLFEQAFKLVSVNVEAVNGNSIFNKLVSDALDVGEVLFNYDLFKRSLTRFDVINWDKQVELDKLSSTNARTPANHRLIAKTLRLFLNQAGSSSNFDKMQSLHLIQCNNIFIGGTSPSTLFFASHNDKYQLASLKLKIGNDDFFDSGLMPLHRRSLDFQKYLYGLFKLHPSLQTEMILFWNYLETSLKALQIENEENYNTLLDYIQNFDESVYNQAFVELDPWVGLFDGISYRKNVGIGGDVDSDFLIKADYPDGKLRTANRLPLVLGNGFARQLNYVGGAWNPKTVVPYKADADFAQRTLPGQHLNYPYLTVSDFLEPALIELPYRLNKEYFFDGNPNGFSDGVKDQTVPDFSYLLPIKPLFFAFFRADFFTRRASDGQPHYKIRKIGLTKVEVELRIPVRGGALVPFRRVYEVGAVADEATNVGVILRHTFNLACLPMTFLNQDNGFYQHLMLIDNDVRAEVFDRHYKLEFYTDPGTTVVCKNHTTRYNKKTHEGSLMTTQFYTMETPYKLIRVNSGNQDNSATGFLLPKFKRVNAGVKQFTFAVDFGTTSTHIEYSVNGTQPQPLEINNTDTQLVTMIEPDCWYYNGLLVNSIYPQFVPALVGSVHQDKFPIATASSEMEGINHATNPATLHEINIGFFFQKYITPSHTQLNLNLKWASLTRGNQAAPNRLKAFLGELLFLIRNKVIHNAGNLAQTRLIWFYPSSMDHAQKGAFSDIWNTHFAKYINSAHIPIPYLEADVPFYMHDAVAVNSTLHPAVNIDIGGGTTDIVVFKNRQPIFISSMKFAGNNLWGDGYANTPRQDNGFVRVYTDEVQNFLDANNFGTLSGILQEMTDLNAANQYRSADIMSFFFSIDRNHEVRRNNKALNLTTLLANDKSFKFVYLVFHSAIIYYTAQVMKAAGQPFPHNVCFSGNGSLMLKLLEINGSLASRTLTRLVFETVYENRPYHNAGVSFVQYPEPKEATCKGGLKKLQLANIGTPISYVWLGDSEGTLIKEQNLVANPNDNNNLGIHLKYSDITQFHKDSVLNEYKDFVDSFKIWHDKMNLKTSFGIDVSSLNSYIDILKDNSKAHLTSGYNRQISATTVSVGVTESLFFYPLIGSLYDLIQNISRQVKPAL